MFKAGNGVCDLDCMTQQCGYDSNGGRSDCWDECVGACPGASLGNSICDSGVF